MAVCIVSMKRANNQLNLIKNYEPFIKDHTCDEIKSYSRELNLPCLQYLDGAGDCIFNYDQCQDIIHKEIPLLRTKNLSKPAQEALDGLEYAIKDTKSAYALLLLEGD